MSKLFQIAAVILMAVSLMAKAHGTVTLSPTSIPNGTVGVAYSATITASGGCTPYTWSIISGAIPGGLTLTVSGDTKSDTLAGTPNTAGTYTFKLQAKACGVLGIKGSQTYTVTISSPVQHQVNLSWTQSITPDVTSNNVYRSLISGGPYSQIFASGSPITGYADSTVISGQTYYYVVTAFDSDGDGESGYSNEAQAVIPSP